MLGISESGFIQALGLIVTLITLGLVPYLISLNARQHDQGIRDRHEQTNILSELKTDVQKTKVEIKSDVNKVRQDISILQEQRLVDKQEFLKLYERFINHEGEDKRVGGVSDSY